MNEINLNINFPVLEKLIDTCASGIGAVAGSWLKKGHAKSDATSILLEAQAKKDAHDISSGKKCLDKDGKLIAVPNSAEFHLVEAEINARINFQEKKRQFNLQSIALKAREYLSNCDTVSSIPVDDDWTARFFSYAQDVSSEEMQKIWAKILSGEIIRPGTYSLKTLSFLRDLSYTDAKLVKNFLNHATEDYFFYECYQSNEYPFTMNEFLKLQELGITHDYPRVAGLELLLELDEARKATVKLPIAGQTVILEKYIEPEKEETFKVTPLTGLGLELRQIIGTNVDNKHIHRVKDCLLSRGFIEVDNH